MKRSAFFVLSLFLTVALSGCGGGQGSLGSGGARIGGQAVDLAMTDINGNAFNLSDHKGKVILLNFFATWCPPCRSEMPDFNTLAQKYPADLSIVGINVYGETEAEVKSFAAALGLIFAIAQDSKKEAENGYGAIRAIPVTFIIDRDFKVAQKFIGARSLEEFEREILKLK